MWLTLKLSNFAVMSPRRKIPRNATYYVSTLYILSWIVSKFTSAVFFLFTSSLLPHLFLTKKKITSCTQGAIKFQDLNISKLIGQLENVNVQKIYITFIRVLMKLNWCLQGNRGSNWVLWYYNFYIFG